MRTLKSIQLAEARDVLEVAMRFAIDRSTSKDFSPVSIAIVDVFGDLLAFERQTGASGRTATFALLKARQSALTSKPTVEEAHIQLPDGNWVPGTAANHRFDDNFRLADVNYTSFAGGYPLVVIPGAYTVGGIGVSGRKQLADHALAERTVEYCIDQSII